MNSKIYENFQSHEMFPQQNQEHIYNNNSYSWNWSPSNDYNHNIINPG